MGYFNQLTDFDTLRRGWHLSRPQLRQQFFDVYLDFEAFSAAFESNIRELSRALRTGEYTIDPLYRLNTPKTTFVSRPGTALSIRNEIVLTGAISLIAHNIDRTLSDAVYSWRVSDKPKKDVLFRESDVLALPFLKRRTIQQFVDPFDAWYLLWPEFDEQSRKTALEDERFKYLVVTDISAYFENIELNVLEAALHERSGADGHFIRFLMEHYRIWSREGMSGRRLGKGIPQSSQPSSFLGNMYLAPIDERISQLYSSDDVRYFRYMDDIRIFCKTEKDAQRCIYEIDDRIRLLGLNIQSAKTEIIPASQMMSRLHDERLDELDQAEDLLKQRDPKAKQEAMKRIMEIARSPGTCEGARPIIGGKGPMKGINLRVLRRWASLCKRAGIADAYDRIAHETLRNPDYRLLNQSIAFARWRPLVRRHAQGFLDAFNGEELFAHRRADLFRYLRYPGRLPSTALPIAWKIFLNARTEGYLRFQAAMLLMRWPLKDTDVKRVARAFDVQADGWDLLARAVCSSQSRTYLPQVINELSASGQARARDFSILLRSAQTQPMFCDRVLNHAFAEQGSHRAVDLAPVLYAMLSSESQLIRLKAASVVRKNRYKLNGDWRDTFLHLATRAVERE